MRKLFVVLFLLGGAGAAGVEIVAPRLAEGRIEQAVAERSRDVVGVKADIDSFPAVTRLLLTEQIRRLTIELDEVGRRGVTWTRVSVQLDGIVLDRAAMFSREVHVKDIESGTLIARIPIDGLPGVGRLVDRFDVSVDGGSLVVARAGRRIASVPLPGELFPCEPSASLDSSDIVLTCSFDDIPSFLVGLQRQG